MKGGAELAGVRTKLEEAYYHLNLMRKDALSDDFRHDLSAFLSAYRSVTLRIERAIGQDATWQAWYLSELHRRGFPWKPLGNKTKWQLGADSVLQHLKALRDTDVHEKDIELRAAANVTLGSIALGITLHPVTARGSADSEEHSPPDYVASDPSPSHDVSRPHHERRWFFNDLPKVEVIPACEAALSELKSLVGACEAKGIA